MRHRVVMDDGAVRHIESIGKVRDAVEGGEHLRFAGVVRDVTHEVARAQLQFEKESAQRSALARSEFMSRLSHEMRTPLNAVIGMAQMLQMTPGEPLTSKQDRHAQIILDSGWHLLRLVDDVLDITSIDSGKVAVVPVPTDLNSVMRMSLDMVEPERQHYGVQIAQQWPAEPATVIADPLRLRQVFVNLLSNGCKYNTPGGQLTLGYREATDEICVIFSDQGAGIPADRLGELFQPFKRLPETAKLPGTGLGLVVVKRLTEQMHGHIDVASEPGHGASFIVWLRKTIPATS